MEFQVRYLALFLFFSVTGSFQWFWMGSFQKNIQYDGVPQGSILGPTLFLLNNTGLPDDVICNIGTYGDANTCYAWWEHSSDLQQQLELASEFKSDL